MVRTLLLSVCPWTLPRLLTFSDQKILCRIRGYSFELRCYSVMNEITATPVVIRSKQSEKAHRICSGVQGSVHHRCGSVGSTARPMERNSFNTESQRLLLGCPSSHDTLSLRSCPPSLPPACACGVSCFVSLTAAEAACLNMPPVNGRAGFDTITRCEPSISLLPGTS